MVTTAKNTEDLERHQRVLIEAEKTWAISNLKVLIQEKGFYRQTTNAIGYLLNTCIGINHGLKTAFMPLPCSNVPMSSDSKERAQILHSFVRFNNSKVKIDDLESEIITLNNGTTKHNL